MQQDALIQCMTTQTHIKAFYFIQVMILYEIRHVRMAYCVTDGSLFCVYSSL